MRRTTSKTKSLAHMQLVSTELDLQVGKPDALKVAHAHMVDAEPDSISWGKPGTPHTDTPVHLAGTEHEVLMGANENKPDEWLLQEMEEEEATMKTASIGGDNDPCVKLQKSGVSHLAIQEGIESLTFSLPPPSTTSEAVRTQRSPVVNTGTPAIPATEGSADLELPQYKAAESPDKDPPEQIRAPADARGLTESPWGKALRRTTWHSGLSQTHRPKGKEPLTEVHGHPPNIPVP